MNLTLEQYEKLTPYCDVPYGGTQLRFITPNVFTRWRVESLQTKEPCTLEWIAGFNSSDILVDVGANVGMYTIVAAATKQVRVFAFEPEAQNYSLLNTNILANGLQDRATAFCLGLLDKAELTVLNMAEYRIGGSSHAVGEALDFQLKPMQAFFRQGCVAETLDNLVQRGAIPVPNHIKIDVDGFEPKVLAGAAQTIRNPACRSLLIELNTNLSEHTAMIGALRELGFQTNEAQIQRAMRKEGSNKGIAEHVFQR